MCLWRSSFLEPSETKNNKEPLETDDTESDVEVETARVSVIFFASPVFSVKIKRNQPGRMLKCQTANKNST